MTVQGLLDSGMFTVLMPDGTYEKPDRRGKLPVSSQKALCELAVASVKAEQKKTGNEEISRVFLPVESQNER